MSEKRISKQVMNWTPIDRRKHGRPKYTWNQGIRKAISERNLQSRNWNDRGKDNWESEDEEGRYETGL